VSRDENGLSYGKMIIGEGLGRFFFSSSTAEPKWALHRGIEK